VVRCDGLWVVPVGERGIIVLCRSIGSPDGGIEVMGKSSVLLRVIGLLTLGLLALGPSHTYAQAPSSVLPAPKGLSSCAPGKREAALARVAAELGSEILGCFLSEKRVMVQGSIMPVPVNLEFAFAMDVPGGPYTSADLDRFLSRTIEKWKDFEPLNKDFENYPARLNELIKGAVASPSVAVSSVKPVLVSIDRVGAKAYSVVSIRSYVAGQLDEGQCGCRRASWVRARSPHNAASADRSIRRCSASGRNC
jgi:hypothetical protein